VIFLLTDRKLPSYDAQRWRGGGGCCGWGSARLSEQCSRTQLKRIREVPMAAKKKASKSKAKKKAPAKKGGAKKKK
jgi:hypothetical protein